MISAERSEDSMEHREVISEFGLVTGAGRFID
jgi:hypothetical protein